MGFRNWKFTIKSGHQLRELIGSGNYNALFDAMIAVWKDIHRVVPEDFDEFDLQDAIDEIESVRGCNVIVNDEIDGLLTEIYDFCDAYDLWLEL